VGEGCSTLRRHGYVQEAVEAFLDQHDLARSTRRVYRASLTSLVAECGPATTVGELSGPKVAGWFRARHATAARLLRANGAPADMARALYAYNPSHRYVRAVTYANQLRANQRAFLGYYHWQVFYGDTLLPEGYPARPPVPAPG
jgi:hypothetical protein